MDVRTMELKCCVDRAFRCLFTRPLGSRCGDPRGENADRDPAFFDFLRVDGFGLDVTGLSIPPCFDR